MAGKEIAVKKYVVRLDAEERDRPQRVDLQRQAFRPAADEGAHPVEGGHIGCGRRLSDSRIAAALDTSIATVEGPGAKLVEEGFEAVLARKYNSNSARRRDFRRRGGSKTDRADPLSGPGGLCQMEPASA